MRQSAAASTAVRYAVHDGYAAFARDDREHAIAMHRRRCSRETLYDMVQRRRVSIALTIALPLILGSGRTPTRIAKDDLVHGLTDGVVLQILAPSRLWQDPPWTDRTWEMRTNTI